MPGRIMKYIAVQFGNPHGFGGQISTFIMNCLNMRQYHAVERLLLIEPGNKILDIGFGNGYLIRYLNRNYPSTQLYGIDISEDMLRTALQKSHEAISNGNMHLTIADVVSLPFEDERFERIYTVNTHYFWSDIDKGLQEIRRVMKPDALFLIVGHYKKYLDRLPIAKYNFKKYEIEEIEVLLQKNGLVLERNICVEKYKSYCLTIRKK